MDTSLIADPHAITHDTHGAELVKIPVVRYVGRLIIADRKACQMVLLLRKLKELHQFCNIGGKPLVRVQGHKPLAGAAVEHGVPGGKEVDALLPGQDGLVGGA